MSKSYDTINGKKVREQYFRSDRLESKHKKPLPTPKELEKVFEEHCLKELVKGD